ncbi:hypothetical protein P8452_26373 [Trifolium repens]|nr:hypothetical protein P8452_26373 [Trifolium repens]
MASSDISDSIPFKSWVHPKFLEIRIYVSLTQKFEGMGVKVGSFKDLEMFHVTCSQRIYISSWPRWEKHNSVQYLSQFRYSKISRPVEVWMDQRG